MNRSDPQFAADTVPTRREQPPVTPKFATPEPRRRPSMVRVAALSVGVLGLAALGLASADPAGASTVNGTATVATPGTTSELDSGGSTTQFTVALPPNAACDGDTATGGYHIYSYLLPKGTALSAVTFTGHPSAGLGYFSSSGTYFGPVNTAIGTGQVPTLPNNFEWAPMITNSYLPLTGASGLLYSGSGSTASGIWESGIVCANTNGLPVDNWNAEITFSANTTDANGFTWTAKPGGSTTTTTTTTTTSTSTTSTTTTTTTSTSTTDPTSTSTSTTAPVVAAAVTGGTGGSTGSSVDGSSTDPTGSSSSTDGTLAFTGLHTARAIGIGLLAVGLGLMLLSWGHRRRVRAGRGTGQ